MSNARNRKRRESADAGPEVLADDGQLGPPLWLRLTLSVVLVWHVAVVFLSPLSVPPASQLVTDIAQSRAVRWYTDSLYLNHGYHFFGPEPPINQLVRYRVTDPAGEVLAEGEFPDKSQQWPRLLYHRHMMLADQAALGPPDIPAPEWLRLTLRGYGRHLLREYGGDRVGLEYVRHQPLSPLAVLDGADPNAPELFVWAMRVDETAAEMDEPLPVPPPPAPPEPATPAEEPAREAIPPGGQP